MVQGKKALAWLTGVALCAAAGYVAAAEQFVPILSYRVGAYAAGGSGIFGGYIDYMNYVNMKQGGVNGVKLTWEECETEYNNSRGVECYERLKKSGPTGATMVQPVSTGITYSLMDRVPADKVPLVTIGYGSSNTADGRVFPWVFPAITTYWSQASSQIKFIGQRLGGMDKLKGKKIALVYHDSAFGKEPIPVFEEYAKKYGFDFMKVAVPHPGNEQQSQWLQIRQAKPDYVLLWGWGVMNPTALKAAAKIGYPRDRIVGVWWSASEEDVIPAGDAAKGYIAGAFNGEGNLPLIMDIKKTVYGAGKGNLEDTSRIGSVYHARGIVLGIVTVEAIRTAQEKFGKGKSMTGDQIRWGLEHLNIDNARIKQLNAVGLIPPFKMSCADHEGSGMAKFTQWDGKQWKTITDWIPADKDLIHAMVEESANKYAKEKNITPRDCGKEG